MGRLPRLQRVCEHLYAARHTEQTIPRALPSPELKLRTAELCGGVLMAPLPLRACIEAAQPGERLRWLSNGFERFVMAATPSATRSPTQTPAHARTLFRVQLNRSIDAHRHPRLKLHPYWC